MFIAVFIEKNNDDTVQKSFEAKKQYMKPISAAALTISAVIVPILGFTPHLTMDKLADLAQGFMEIAHEPHAVHYFAWVNLKGAVISVIIGAVLYFGVVRRWMMKKNADGTVVYVNRWPAFIDLEEKLYRPIIEKLLPAALGFVCSVLDKIFDFIAKIAPRFGGFVCSILDNITDVTTKVLKALGAFFAGILDIGVDGIVVLLRKTVYRTSQPQAELEEGNPLTHAIGVFLNKLEQLLNRTIWRKHEHKKDLEHWFVLKYTSFKENSAVIGRSMSFGLVFFCIGLCATLIYLLVAALI